MKTHMMTDIYECYAVRPKSIQNTCLVSSVANCTISKEELVLNEKIDTHKKQKDENKMIT